MATAAVIGFALALAESGLGLGAVVPGEVGISALAAGAERPAATLMIGLAVALGATAGDHLGYVLGRRGGSRLRDSRLITRVGTGKWDRASRFVQSHGFWAMFASRLLPVVRTVMPAVAGAAGLGYRPFLLASILGAVTWAALWVGAGAGFAQSGALDHPELLLGMLALALVVLVGRRLVLRRHA